MAQIRPAQLCRSWLFLEGANEAVLQRAPASGADVLIHELEDFTPPALRPAARALARDLYGSWRAAGRVVAVRVNPLEGDGMEDLAAVMRGLLAQPPSACTLMTSLLSRVSASVTWQRKYSEVFALKR